MVNGEGKTLKENVESLKDDADVFKVNEKALNTLKEEEALKCDGKVFKSDRGGVKN